MPLTTPEPKRLIRKKPGTRIKWKFNLNWLTGGKKRKNKKYRKDPNKR